MSEPRTPAEYTLRQAVLRLRKRASRFEDEAFILGSDHDAEATQRFLIARVLRAVADALDGSS